MAARSNMPVMREARTRSRRNRRLIFLLMLFFITILLLLFFHSSFSRITTIEIAGNRYVSQEQVMEASGIELNDHYFAVSAEKIRQRVMTIDTVQDTVVTKRFPGFIQIEIAEYPEVAYQITADGRPEALLANGTALAIKDGDVIIDKPILTDWADEEMKSRLTAVLADIPPDLLSDISEIRHQPNPTSYPDKIVMYTRSRYQIVTTIEKLPEKIRGYRLIIENLSDMNVNGGVITMLEADVFSPFPESALDEEEEAAEEPDKGDMAE